MGFCMLEVMCVCVCVCVSMVGIRVARFFFFLVVKGGVCGGGVDDFEQPKQIQARREM